MERKRDVADNKAYSFLHEVDRGGLTYPMSLAVCIASTVYRVVTVLTSYGIDEPIPQISNQVFRAVFWLLYCTCTKIQTAKTDKCHAPKYRRKLFENCSGAVLAGIPWYMFVIVWRTFMRKEIRGLSYATYKYRNKHFVEQFCETLVRNNFWQHSCSQKARKENAGRLKFSMSLFRTFCFLICFATDLQGQTDNIYVYDITCPP